MMAIETQELSVDQVQDDQCQKERGDRDYILDARQVAMYTSLMGRFFPIGTGFSGFTGRFLELVANLFAEQMLKGFIVGKLYRTLFFSEASFVSSSHSGNLSC